MIDEKKIIKKLEHRIDVFVKEHPEEKDCLAVQSVREFKQMLEAEAKEQAEKKSLESELLGRLVDMKESKEAFCDEQGEKCGLYESCFQCAAAGIVDIIKQLEEEQEYSYADFDGYVREVAPYLDAEYNDDFCEGIKRAIMVIRAVGRERIKEYGCIRKDNKHYAQTGSSKKSCKLTACRNDRCNEL